MDDKKIFVTRPSMPSFEEYTEEIKSIWESQWLTNNGAEHEKLKKELQDYLGVEHVELLTNGHMALELSLQALGLKGEVITTPFTFVSTTNAIVRNGLKPVFCDIRPDDYTMDPDKIESLITENTCAIMPVHVYGNVCQIEKIGEIARKHHLAVIYDAAHTFGIRYKGRGIAGYGDASCFSFHATKVFNTIEGGAVCCNAEMAETFGKKLACLKDFGIVDEETVSWIGPNAKMNEFCAAMGLCNLRHVNDEIARRKLVNDRYRKNLEGIEGIQLNAVQKDVTPNYAYFPVVFDKEKFGADRDEVFAKLKENNIFARKYFYPAVNAMDCYKEYDPMETPVAYCMSHSVLTLPMYASLGMDEIDRICEVIRACGK